MDLSFLGDIFGSGVIGGALGAIAPLVANAQKRKQQAIDNTHELELGKLSIQELELSQAHQLLVADKQIDISESETAGEIAVSELGVDLEIVKGQSESKGAIAWVRPALTAFVLIVFTAFSIAVWVKVGGLDSLTASDLQSLFSNMIDTLSEMTVAGFFFWFTARQISK